MAMKPTLNHVELDMVLTLQNYTYAQPKHINGLCYWLTNISRHDECAPYIGNGYLFIGTAARAGLVPSYLSKRLLENEKGPTKARISLANKLIRLVMQRKLQYCQEQFLWVTA